MISTTFKCLSLLFLNFIQTFYFYTNPIYSINFTKIEMRKIQNILLFTFLMITSLSYAQDTKADYQKDEPKVVEASNWLMNTPIDEKKSERLKKNTFLMKWMTGCPYISIGVSPTIVTYTDCGDCLMIFLSGWTKYAIESKDYGNALKGNLAGTESVIQFYTTNKKALGKNKNIEKLIKLKKKGKLEEYIQQNMAVK